jgi:hypothetical protein
MGRLGDDGDGRLGTVGRKEGGGLLGAVADVAVPVPRPPEAQSRRRLVVHVRVIPVTDYITVEPRFYVLLYLRIFDLRTIFLNLLLYIRTQI